MCLRIQLLFNVKEDLYELNNLIEDHPDVADRMRQYMPSDFCVPKNGTIFETLPEENSKIEENVIDDVSSSVSGNPLSYMPFFFL